MLFRSKRIHIPKQMKKSEPMFLQYGEVAMQGEQLSRVYKVFNKNNVHFILFDDLKINTQEELIKVLKFLEVDSSKKIIYKINIKQVNVNKTHFNFLLSKLIIEQPGILASLNKYIKILNRGKPLGLRNFILELNKKIVKREPLDASFRKELLEYFRNDINKLQILINKDMSK